MNGSFGQGSRDLFKSAPLYTPSPVSNPEGVSIGIGDFVDKAKDLASEHEDQVTEGIDKAANMADEKTEGKYSDQIDQGVEKAKDFVEGLDDEE